MATLSLHFPMVMFSTLGGSGIIRRNLLSCRRAPGSLRVRSHASTAPEVGMLDQPRWIGKTPLSRLVGALISFKPLFNILKFFARQVVISTAEKSNLPWDEMVKEILESDVYEEMDRVRDSNLVYPDYYLNPFHAYNEGNLSWLAAAEAEAATMAMAKRTFPDVSSIYEANTILRENWLQAIEKHILQHSGNTTVNDILDIGCSVGFSTGYLVSKFPTANVSGLDLSPYFLAVAQYKDNKKRPESKKVTWIHANGESTGLPSNSFDLVSISFMFHECPARATRAVLKEAYRLIRSNGTIAVTDNSPKSKIIQNLPPSLFTLMKSTEPFLDEFYLLDLDETMREAGFKNVNSVFIDPRHVTVTGTVEK